MQSSIFLFFRRTSLPQPAQDPVSRESVQQALGQRVQIHITPVAALLLAIAALSLRAG